ncbi:bifunctional folylpolyglutamate synthase/dihydrofolate synthase [Acidipila rosea]|nr:folylpolyglutamate synthase/dihydrofolate synthase family protein [Acidipila rosea]
MSYTAAIDGLMSLAGELQVTAGGLRRKFELGHMRVLMAALGEPQMKFPSVLIAGTNGKGSTAATLASILHEAGYTMGLYTSPHLERVNERIQFNGEPIEDEQFARLYFQVDDTARQLVTKAMLPAMPSFFETLTALAFLAFAERQVDIAILEVGMGGRLDATNIVEPLLSIITDISLDHTEWLGPTITDIAREKAGILRRGGTLITLPQHPEANQAIGEIAVSLEVRGVSATEYLPARTAGSTPFHNQYPLSVLGQVIEVNSPLAGQHQQRNLALAIAAAVELGRISNSDSYNHNLISNCNSYNISAAHIEAGIRKARWPGRLEFIDASQRRPKILLDVGHNPAGAWALRSALSSLEPEDAPPTTKTLVFGCLRDKAIDEIAQVLFPLFDRVVLTPVHSPRSASLERLLEATARTGVPVSVAENAQEAVAAAIAQTPEDGLIVVSGSVYLVGEVRSALKTQ